MTIRTRADVIM